MISGRALEGGDGFDDYIDIIGILEKVKKSKEHTKAQASQVGDCQMFFFFQTPLKIILSQSILCYLRLIIQSSEQFVSFE